MYYFKLSIYWFDFQKTSLFVNDYEQVAKKIHILAYS
ncbi:MAG: hypothetical protein RL172_271 [Bacteroidota bacterium]|jgi:hypothetical protein